MTAATLEVDDLLFEIRSSPRRRTIEVIVDRDGSLVIAAPSDAPPQVLEDFVEDNKLWIYTKLLEKETQSRSRAPKEYVSGEGFYYLGRKYRLKVVEDGEQRAALRLYRSRFLLRQGAVPQAREHFIHWYTVHLLPVLDRHVSSLAPRIGVHPRDVHIQDLGYRWGSCNPRGHLYFHWRMAMLPRSTIEYLVAHELAHLAERNHSEAFWKRLERTIPDYVDRQRWLREHGGIHDL